jgi:hypothetical protein
LAFLSFAYFCWCAFAPLFEFRISSYYRMMGQQQAHTLSHTITHPHALSLTITPPQTDGYSMLVHSSYVLRIVPPLTYTFLSMLRVDNSAFESIMGNMQAVPFFGSTFNNYLPLLVLIFCLLTLFNVFGRLLSFLQISHFKHSETFQDDGTMSEGRILLKRDRQRKQRFTDVRDFIPGQGTREDSIGMHDMGDDSAGLLGGARI